MHLHNGRVHRNGFHPDAHQLLALEFFEDGVEHHPSGRIVDYNYATGGGCCNSRLASVVDQTTNTNVVHTRTYKAFGGSLTQTLGNGATQSFAYNSRLQLTRITAAAGGNTVMDFTYDYGTSSQNTGRVRSRTDAVQPEHSATYSYDSIYRLKQVQGADQSWGIAWEFDIWGNRRTQTPSGLATSKVGTQTLGYTNNRNTASIYDYDAAGNQTNDGTHNYTFNAENQITQMDAGAAFYAYDGDGRRMKKTLGTETTYYFYAVGVLVSEFSTTNTGATAAASTDRTTYQTSDKLGTAVLIMAAAGLVVENNRSLPYGEEWQPAVGSDNEQKFTSYQRDAESGLDYAIHRFDATTRGVFMSVDRGPINLLLPQSLNRYIYAMADPLNYTDPSGLVREIPFPPPLRPIYWAQRPTNSTLLGEELEVTQQHEQARWSWQSPFDDCVISRTHGPGRTLTDVARRGVSGFNELGPFRVNAIASGVVEAVGTTTSEDGSINFVAIYDAASDSTIYYMHLTGSVGGAPLRRGAVVTAGSSIGFTDRSGEAAGRNTGWHAHMYYIQGRRHTFSREVPKHSVAPFFDCSQ